MPPIRNATKLAHTELAIAGHGLQLLTWSGSNIIRHNKTSGSLMVHESAETTHQGTSCLERVDSVKFNT